MVSRIQRSVITVSPLAVLGVDLDDVLSSAGTLEAIVESGEAHWSAILSVLAALYHHTYTCRSLSFCSIALLGWMDVQASCPV